MSRLFPALIPGLAALVVVGCGGHDGSAESASRVPAGDTAWPPRPDKEWVVSSDTIAYPLLHAENGNIYRRTVLLIKFDSTSSGSQIRAVLADFHGRIIAGPTGRGRSVAEYVVEIPDPGPDLDALLKVVDTLSARPGVYLALPLGYSVPFHPYDP